MTAAPSDLVRDLQRRVRILEDDLRAQAERVPAVAERLFAEYAAARGRGRTAESPTAWREAQITQAAVAWVLGSVFVRFCEDNDLTTRRWIAGVGPGLARAVDAQAAWIEANPRLNDRDWLREGFRWLRSTRAGASLFPDTDFVWWWDLSADAAEALIGFLRRRGGDGELVHRFDSPEWDTRFLGDLYQDLSEAARKRYALLQTPEFVEEFILDLTLDPALDEFGIEGFRMIDPTCGSGHFLLGGFRRLLDGWHAFAPAMDRRVRVQRALDGVWGVDVNPAATAIAKFRLTIAALRACGASGLDTTDAPDFTGHLHLATGDSLIWGSGTGRQTEMTFDETDPLGEHHYAWEDVDRHPGILDRGRYHVVVGNPPYITVKDKALNDAYRLRYTTCAGKYALSVPFAELFFRLAVHDLGAAGVVGQITSNSFMKREFGKKLIEEYLPTLDLTHVIDTSGAYIPGHGTPTVILVGRRRSPQTQLVRAVLGVRGEPSTPAVAAKGIVWTSIVDSLDQPGRDTGFISVADVPRERLARHPWALAGAGAADLKAQLEIGTRPLANTAESLGILAVLGEEDAYILPHRTAAPTIPVVDGKWVRDYASDYECRYWPYDDALRHIPKAGTETDVWPMRQLIRNYVTFGRTKEDQGLHWTEYWVLNRSRLNAELLIAWGEVATHNHFVLARRGMVFKQTAPVVKLPAAASENDYFRVLGLLGSSTVCFWLKQTCFNKGGDHVGTEGARVSKSAWEDRFAFNSKNVEQLPVPATAPLDRARHLDAMAQEFSGLAPSAVCDGGIPSSEALEAAHRCREAVRAEMIATQEELDWEVYRHYGVIDGALTYGGDDLPDLALGERAFEIVLARKMAAGEVDTVWFERHGSTPITEIPAHWPAAYRELVQRRIELIEKHPLLHLIERPECKRRWATEPWEEQQAKALRGWLLDRLEEPELWRDGNGPRTLSVAQLADSIRGDADFRQVLDLSAGRPDYDLAREVGKLVRDEAVPYLAVRRYKPTGMRKRTEWEQTWALQRDEDAGKDIGTIPVPPKYTNADFRVTSYWRQRGKLDVPKERFVSYPGTERAGDSTPVLGWAGWDHLTKAQALARLILDRQANDGWEGARLTEPLAGLAELEPWLHQWHAEPDPLYGSSPADFYTTFLDEEAQAAGLTRADLAPLAALPTDRDPVR